jgi:hypothetical protein
MNAEAPVTAEFENLLAFRHFVQSNPTNLGALDPSIVLQTSRDDQFGGPTPPLIERLSFAILNCRF